jgi:glycosyltransferase involved in cell wall biosynthesis
MLQKLKTVEKPNALNRAAWHKPLISIVITHFNYADHIEDAILSLLDQSYENWECVIVDDASSYEQHAQLVVILDRIGSTKIRLVEHSENLGQIPAFFTGLDATCGDFVCLLDPDDRYAETFLEEALGCHLNESVYCPIACTEQILLTGNGVITGGGYSWHNRARMQRRGAGLSVDELEPRLLYFEAEKNGWFWTSTSAMMFRRAACELLRPHRPLAYKGSADSYMAKGAHMLGGTLFYTKPLVYRGLHDNNAFITANIYASKQSKRKTYGEERTKECHADVREAILHNGGTIIEFKPKRNKLLSKWRNSIVKRWRKLFG